MENNTQHQRFLITYVTTEDFNRIMEEESNKSSEEQNAAIKQSLQFVKFVAPNLDEVGNMLASKFSDVQVIGIAAESDFILSMEKLNNAGDAEVVYVVGRTDANGNVFTDIFMDNTGLNKDEIISTLSVSEFKNALSTRLNYLQDEDTKTVHFEQN